jgi:hypothetical protein
MSTLLITTDRFFLCTLSGGQLYVSGVQPWETWDSTKLEWQDAAHVDTAIRESSTAHKVTTVREWDAIVRGPGPSHVAQIWVRADLEAVVRGRFEMHQGTLASFTQNIVLFKNLRRRLRDTQQTRSSQLKETIEQSRDEIETMRGADGRFGYAALPWMESRLSLMHLMEQELGLLGGEEEFGRRTAFVYLMAVFDGFVAGWHQDMGLTTADDFVSGGPQAIRDACAQLQMTVTFPPDFDQRLAELRERRNVFVHRGGRADRRYCEVTGQPELLNQRLDVSEAYLDQAEEFISHVVWERIVTNSPSRQS